MVQRLAFLIGGTLALWVALVYPASRLLGPEALIQSLSAMLLCLLPAVATMAFALRAFTRSSEEQLLAILGGTGLRMAVVLGFGLLGFVFVPELHANAFWIWLIVFYAATLALEMTLLRAQAVGTTRLASSFSCE